MPNDAVVFLGRPGKEAGHVDEGAERDIEGVAEANEAGALTEALISRAPARMRGWLPTIPTTRRRAGQTRSRVLRKVLLDLHEAALVHHAVIAAFMS